MQLFLFALLSLPCFSISNSILSFFSQSENWDESSAKTCNIFSSKTQQLCEDAECTWLNGICTAPVEDNVDDMVGEFTPPNCNVWSGNQQDCTSTQAGAEFCEYDENLDLCRNKQNAASEEVSAPGISSNSLESFVNSVPLSTSAKVLCASILILALLSLGAFFACTRKHNRPAYEALEEV